MPAVTGFPSELDRFKRSSGDGLAGDFWRDAMTPTSSSDRFGCECKVPRKSRLAGGVALPETAGVNQSVVKVDPEIMSGAPCFAGTRVPIQNLIDYLEGGDSIGEFLDGFPSVSREQVIAFLEEAKTLVLAAAVE
jgi:uncharacterized protein (DUF433 family)